MKTQGVGRVKYCLAKKVGGEKRRRMSGSIIRGSEYNVVLYINGESRRCVMCEL